MAYEEGGSNIGMYGGTAVTYADSFTPEAVGSESTEAFVAAEPTATPDDRYEEDASGAKIGAFGGGISYTPSYYTPPIVSVSTQLADYAEPSVGVFSTKSHESVSGSDHLRISPGYRDNRYVPPRNESLSKLLVIYVLFNR